MHGWLWSKRDLNRDWKQSINRGSSRTSRKISKYFVFLFFTVFSFEKTGKKPIIRHTHISHTSQKHAQSFLPRDDDRDQYRYEVSSVRNAIQIHYYYQEQHQQHTMQQPCSAVPRKQTKKARPTARYQRIERTEFFERADSTSISLFDGL